ncbi:hypothetical protein [Rhizobium sp.]
MMIPITSDQTTTFDATGEGSWYVDTDVTVSISGPAIDASGDVTGRSFLFKGTLASVYGPAITLGDEGGVADSDTTITVDYRGFFKSGGTGLLAWSGGVTFRVTGDDINGAGTVEASALALDLRQGGNTIENDGAIRSTANTAIVSAGALDAITNNGAIEGNLHGIVSSGDGIEITNNGALTATRGYGIISSGTGLTFTNTGTLSAKKDAVLATGDGATITNSAVITSSKGAGISVSGDDATITSSTRITGKTHGILSTGDGADITNLAMVRSAGIGIQATGDGSVVNTNSQLWGKVALVLGGADSIATNANEIHGTSKTDAAVKLSGSADFTNNGAIFTKSGHAISAGNGDNSIQNIGSIHGDVKLGGGNDWFSSLFGEVDGKVYGGKGNDIYEAGIKLRIVEKAGEGTDTVYARFSWTLGANIENLILTGEAKADATGNKLANILTGNAGDNRFWGLGGRDIFVMQTDGGRDTIMDFQDRKELIDFRGVEGITGFADIEGQMQQVGRNVKIDLADEAGLTLIVRNIDLDHLTARDFLFEI